MQELVMCVLRILYAETILVYDPVYKNCLLSALRILCTGIVGGYIEDPVCMNLSYMCVLRILYAETVGL